MPVNKPIKIGILVLSDRASKNQYKDLSGKAIIKLLTNYLRCSWEPVYKIVPDEKSRIKQLLIRWTDQEKCSLIVTTGGTGPSQRDVTPEATIEVCQKILPGFGEIMRAVSWNHVPTAILSRQTAGIRNQTLILNFPGNPRSIQQCLPAVFPAIVDCMDILRGEQWKVSKKFFKTIRTLHGKTT